MAVDYLPVFAGAKPFTATCSATVTAGQLVEVTTTGNVGPAGAGSLKVVGVAGQDGINGSKITVWPIHGCVHETVTPAGVTAGATLLAAAAGTVDSGTPATLAAAGTDIGTALTTATAGLKCRWIAR